MEKHLPVALAVALASIGATGCQETCGVKGETQTCTCGSRRGAQVCQGDGSWGACDCGPSSQSDGGQPTEYITGGQLTRSFAATGALVGYQGSAFCSATLVAPNKVLTAAHCVANASSGSITFALGSELSRPSRSSAVLSNGVAVNPLWNGNFQNGNDLAVLTLATPITDVAPALLRTSGAPMAGDSLTLVGYGRTSGDQITGIRRLARVTLAQVTAQSLLYQFMGMGACQGDSGGPAFWFDGTNWWQVGVTSFGDMACMQYAGYQRVDAHAAWLSAQGVPMGASAGTCGKDSACNGQCEEDEDCWSLVCGAGTCSAPASRCLRDGSCDQDCGSADPDCSSSVDYCRAYGLYGNGRCDVGCPQQDPDCSQVRCTPVRYLYDQVACYWYDANNTFCGSTPIYFDPSLGVYRC